MPIDINTIVRQLLKHKVTTNIGDAMRIAEFLIQAEKAQSPEDLEFKQLLLAALTPQEIMTIGGKVQQDELKAEIAALKKQIEALKIAIEGLKDRANSQPAGQPSPASQSAEQPPQQAEAPKKVKTIAVGYGEARQEFDPSKFSVEKMFYRGNKR
ncbi:MAG: hypothetical protein V1735_01370 [Nanoarchaeota archaeon]